VVYVGSSDGSLYALDSTTGSLVWEYSSSGSTSFVTSSVSLGLDGLILYGVDEVLLALNQTSGFQVWNYTTDSGYVASAPAVSQSGIVYVSSTDHDLYAVDGTTGHLLWKFRTQGMVQSSPVLSDDTLGFVYVGSEDGYLYALEADTGAPVWKFQTAGLMLASPALSKFNGGLDKNYTLFLVSSGPYDSTIYALDAETSQMVWSSVLRGGEGVYAAPVVASDGTLFVGSNSEPYFYAFDDATGNLKARFESEYIKSSAAIGSDGTVYVGTNGGNLFAFGSPVTNGWIPVELVLTLE